MLKFLVTHLLAERKKKQNKEMKLKFVFKYIFKNIIYYE